MKKRHDAMNGGQENVAYVAIPMEDNNATPTIFIPTGVPVDGTNTASDEEKNEHEKPEDQTMTSTSLYEELRPFLRALAIIIFVFWSVYAFAFMIGRAVYSVCGDGGVECIPHRCAHHQKTVVHSVEVENDPRAHYFEQYVVPRKDLQTFNTRKSNYDNVIMGEDSDGTRYRADEMGNMIPIIEEEEIKIKEKPSYDMSQGSLVVDADDEEDDEVMYPEEPRTKHVPLHYHSTELTLENIHDFHDSFDAVFINYGTPWAIWCQRLAPTWEQFAAEMQQRWNRNLLNMNVGVGRVDCVAQAQLCRERGIMAFPTLRWYQGHGVVEDYKRDRTVEALLEYSFGMMNSYGMEDESEDEEEESGDGAVAEPSNAHGLSMPIPQGEEEEEEEEELSDVYETNKPQMKEVPLQYHSTDITSENMQGFQKSHDAVFINYGAPWAIYSQRLAPTWEKFAAKVQHEWNVDLGVGRVDCAAQARLCKDEGIRAFPTLKWYQGNGEALVSLADKSVDALLHVSKTIMEDFQKVENMNGILQDEGDADADEEEGDAEDETDEPQIQETSLKYHSTDLTSENMREFHKTHAAVFINFCAPWVVWCQRLEPTWEKFAAQAKGIKGLGVGRVDCVSQADICQLFSVMAFPTLRWYEGGDGRYITEFKGDRTTKEMIDFTKSKMLYLKNREENSSDKMGVELSNVDEKDADKADDGGKGYKMDGWYAGNESHDGWHATAMTDEGLEMEEYDDNQAVESSSAEDAEEADDNIDKELKMDRWYHGNESHDGWHASATGQDSGPEVDTWEEDKEDGMIPGLP